METIEVDRDGYSQEKLTGAGTPDRGTGTRQYRKTGTDWLHKKFENRNARKNSEPRSQHAELKAVKKSY